MEQQLSLLDYRPPLPPINFRGATYDIAFDWSRLNRQMRLVHEFMQDGQWRTLREIEAATGAPQASASARLRDYRSNQYLSQFFTMTHRRRGDPKLGIFEYSVTRK